MWKLLLDAESHVLHKRACVDELKTLITRLIRKIWNLYQAKKYHERNSKEFRKELVGFGLLTHGNVNTHTDADRTIRRRVQYINTCMDYQNSLVLDAFDLREKFLLYDIHRNATSYEALLPKFELLFIKQQNKMNQLLTRDVQYGCDITMAGILNNWSTRRWKKWNLYVCFVKYFMYQ